MCGMTLMRGVTLMRLLVIALSLGLVVPALAAQSPTFDLVIRSGRIAAIGRLDSAKAKQTVDARGRVVAPGFIDMLGQSELAILANPSLPSKIFQGITT